MKRMSLKQKLRIKGEIPMRRCMICKSKEKLTLDHKIPLSRGGTNDVDNLVCMCETCNQIKSQITLSEIIRWTKYWESIRENTKFLNKSKHAKSS